MLSPNQPFAEKIVIEEVTTRSISKKAPFSCFIKFLLTRLLAGHHPPPVSQKVVAFLERSCQLEVLEGEREGGKGGQA